MDEDVIVIGGIVVLAILGVAVGVGMWNDNKIVELVDKGVHPMTATCVITGRQSACLLAAKIN